MKTIPSTASPFVDFKQVKANVNILHVLERYGLMDTFKQTGNDRLSGPCPIHNGSNPTAFRVSISKNCFNCFGSCGRGGNVIDFVALKEAIPFRDAALLLQDWFMNGSSSSAPAKTRTRPANRAREEKAATAAPPDRGKRAEPAKSDDENDEGAAENPPLSFELKTLKPHPYLAERDLEPETIEHFGLGYCGRGVLRGHIAIPIHNANGELVAYAGRWPGEPPEGQAKYKLPKGFRKSLEIFNLHRALAEPDDLPLVIVEGFFDCFALWQAGITKCVALMGCALSDEQEHLLSDALPNGGTIELLLDNDDAGRQGTEEVARRLLKFALVRSIPLPDGVQQVDELPGDELAVLFE